MQQEKPFLPRRLSSEEVMLVPTGWARILSRYPAFRKKALKEAKPGTYTFLAASLVALVKRDRQLIDRAIELTKDNVPKYFSLSLAGAILCDCGSKEEGIRMLREAAELSTSHSVLLNLAAKTNDLEEKEALARRVLEADPSDSEALQCLAYAKYFKGEREEAERLTDEILAAEPDNIYTREQKGDIHFGQGQYDKALEQYLKIKVNPLPVSLQFRICRCYYSLGKIKKAKRVARKIHDKVPHTYEIEYGVDHAVELLDEILRT